MRVYCNAPCVIVACGRTSVAARATSGKSGGGPSGGDTPKPGWCAAAATMRVGDRVVVFGLQSRADLNECSATILTCLDNGRHQVQVHTTAGGEKVKVKPDNLHIGFDKARRG